MFLIKIDFFFLYAYLFLLVYSTISLISNRTSCVLTSYLNFRISFQCFHISGMFLTDKMRESVVPTVTNVCSLIIIKYNLFCCLRIWILFFLFSGTFLPHIFSRYYLPNIILSNRVISKFWYVTMLTLSEFWILGFNQVATLYHILQVL